MTTTTPTKSYSTANLRVEGGCSNGRHLHKFYVRDEHRPLNALSESLGIDHSYLSHILSPHNSKTGSPALISQLARLLEVHPVEVVKLLKELGKGSPVLREIWDPFYLNTRSEGDSSST